MKRGGQDHAKLPRRNHYVARRHAKAFLRVSSRSARSPVEQAPPLGDAATQRVETDRWRRDSRADALQLIVARTVAISWSPKLFRLLLEELYPDDSFQELLGDAADLSVQQYPQAVAVALALRHSWRPDDLARVARQLGISLSPRNGCAVSGSLVRQTGTNGRHSTSSKPAPGGRR